MSDPRFEGFLRRQLTEGLALAAESSVLDLMPLGAPPDRFVARFTCRGLVREPSGAVVEASEFVVGIRFPVDYLRRADTFSVLTWLGPPNIWHPNICDRAPAICVGRIAPGTGLVDLLFQCWEVITWNNVTMREDNALNPAACEWARGHLARFPVDRTPLKRRPLNHQIDQMDAQPPAGGSGDANELG